MTSNSAYAPYLQTYGKATPYLTVDEYQRAPTAIDVSNLVSGGPQSQKIALLESISRASSWIDQYVTGSAYNTLCATSNVENARVWGNRQGQIIVHPKLWPILEVQAFNYSVPGAGFTQTQVTPAGNIWIEPQQFIVQPNATYSWNTQKWSNTYSTNYGGAWPTGITTQQYLCEWTYVNGFPNTATAASVNAGDTSITVTSGIGVYPGTQLTIFDAPHDEYVVVADTYTPGDKVIPLTAPVLFDHEVERSVTNLPNAVKEAAILMTTALIKERGSGALIAQDMGVITTVDTARAQGSQGDIALAKEMLSHFRQMFIGY